MALGASPQNVEWLGLGHAAAIGGVGLAIGLVGAIVFGVVARGIAASLPGPDPLTYAGARLPSRSCSWSLRFYRPGARSRSIRASRCAWNSNGITRIHAHIQYEGQSGATSCTTRARPPFLYARRRAPNRAQFKEPRWVSTPPGRVGWIGLMRRFGVVRTSVHRGVNVARRGRTPQIFQGGEGIMTQSTCTQASRSLSISSRLLRYLDLRSH